MGDMACPRCVQDTRQRVGEERDGFNAVSAAECLEGLEEEKYVLEVY